MTSGPPISQLKDILSNIKANVWLEGQESGKSEDEIQQQWLHFAQEITPLLAVPTSVNPPAYPSPATAATDVLTAPSFQVPQVGAVPMQRCRTDQPTTQSVRRPGRNASINPRKRANSTTFHNHGRQLDMYTPVTLTADRRDQPGEGCRKMARTMSAFSRATMPIANPTVFDDPAEFLAAHRLPSTSHSRSNSASQLTGPRLQPGHISGSPSLHSPLSSSYTSSGTPLTPDSAGIHAGAPFSPVDMGRQGSLGGAFRTGFNSALKINSPSSDDSQQTATQQSPFDRSQLYFPSLAEETPQQQFEAEDQTSSVPDIAVSAPALSTFPMFGRETMKPDSHVTRHGKAGSVDQPDTSRSLQAMAMERPLMPKVGDGGIATTQLTAPQMIRIKSETGAPPSEKWQIPRASYNRPQKEKLKCNSCNKYPGGFRGDHELRRHRKLHHSPKRTAWICVDASENGSMLSNCKHCRDRKQYGAYYNAAAHLRRVHFNPKQSHRKARGEQSDRAGKGGGDWPPMEQLKSKWMREVEVEVDCSPTTSDEDDCEEEEAEENVQNMHEKADDRAVPFTNANGGYLRMSCTVADAGIFGSSAADFDYMAAEPTFDSFDMLQSFEDEVFPFEAPTNIDGV